MATVDKLVAKLKELGGSANNPDLKQALGLKDRDWDLVKKSALKSGQVVAGRGFGGRLMLAEKAPPQVETRNPSPTSSGFYGALRGKKLMLVDKEGKALGKLQVIGELAVTEGMVVAVVE